MRGEHVTGDNDLAGGTEIGPRIGHHLANSLQAEEGGVALVHMADGGLDPHFAESAHAANPKNHLLPHAHLFVAAVERVGDALVGGLVFENVTIQQIQRNSAHFGAPNLQSHFAIGKFNRNADGGTVFPAHEGKGHLVEVVLRVDLLLPSIVGKALAEVATIVKQPHGNQREPQITGRLQMVSR